jgi:ubiquinone/menaquinone biosynthesis C-methylase UbiE/glycosyltransferase involved in cell wall biosynthesis
MSRAMLNIITRDTKKSDVLEQYKKYQDTNPKGIEPYHRSTVEPIVCEIPDGSKVLDVGCNSGELMKHLRDTKGCDVTGVDVAEEPLKLAREKGLDVLNADAEHLPFTDGEFDVVILREVLAHLHDPVKALKEIRRVLKPSGFLLGSAPHANIENNVWDDKAPHHRYFTEESLLEALNQAFEMTHLRVLTGAQFSMGFAMSHMAEKPAELLWKSGNADVPEWEHALTSDNKTLRVWMGPTQPPGDAYYRMIGFAEKMRKMSDTEVGYETFSWKSNDGCSDWQTKILMSDDGEISSSIAFDTLCKLIKVADPLVFQVTYFEDVLTLFESIKDFHKDKKLITECDDWIFDIPAYNVASNPYKPNSDKEKIADQQFRLSDAIIVSTSFLKEALSTMYPDKAIHVIPNAIDFDLWDNVKGDGVMTAKKDGVVRLGFSGCGNHGGDLEMIKPVLLKLLEDFPNLEIVISAEFECFKDVKHERFIVPGRWVDIMSYPSMIKGWDLDIGIAPLRDNQFNRSKSNLRWLEYSALGIPTVASRVRPFTESIHQAVDGVLCSTKQEWYSALKQLIEDADLRKTIGASAYERVKKDFNMDEVAKKYRDLLEGIKHGPVRPLQ